MLKLEISKLDGPHKKIANLIFRYFRVFRGQNVFYLVYVCFLRSSL